MRKDLPYSEDERFISPCAFTNESVSILATEFPQLHLRLHLPILVIKLISLHQGRDLRSSHAIYPVIRNLARVKYPASVHGMNYSARRRYLKVLFYAFSLSTSLSLSLVVFGFSKKIGSNVAWIPARWRPGSLFFIPGKLANLFFNSRSEQTDVRENLRGRSFTMCCVVKIVNPNW